MIIVMAWFRLRRTTILAWTMVAWMIIFSSPVSFGPKLVLSLDLDGSLRKRVTRNLSVQSTLTCAHTTTTSTNHERDESSQRFHTKMPPGMLWCQNQKTSPSQFRFQERMMVDASDLSQIILSFQNSGGSSDEQVAVLAKQLRCCLLLPTMFSLVLWSIPGPAIGANMAENFAWEEDAVWLLPTKQEQKRQLEARKRISNLRELQDERLSRCIDRGEFWEQCFFSGMRDDINGIDYQWGSPEAALEVPQPKDSLEKARSPKPPTW